MATCHQANHPLRRKAKNIGKPTRRAVGTASAPPNAATNGYKFHTQLVKGSKRKAHVPDARTKNPISGAIRKPSATRVIAAAVMGQCALTFAFCRAACGAQRAEGVGQRRAVRALRLAKWEVTRHADPTRRSVVGGAPTGLSAHKSARRRTNA